MKHKMAGVLAASVGVFVVALMLSGSEAYARSGTGSGFAATHPRAAVRALPHHRGRHWAGWPGLFYDPSTGAPVMDAPQPPSGDVHYTYTYDVPWDWAHRYPPGTVSPERTAAPGCPSETVTVPGAGGRDKTVNIIRCY